MRKYRERLFGSRRHAAPLLDAQLPWTALTPAEARALWRRMADRHLASNGEEFGVRAAEGVIDAIYSVSARLREEHLIAPDTARACPMAKGSQRRVVAANEEAAVATAPAETHRRRVPANLRGDQ